MLEIIRRLDLTEQREIVSTVKELIRSAPLFQKTMPRTGTPFNYRCSNAGPFGWTSDIEGGYRYVDRHPLTHQPWPTIPPPILKIVRFVTSVIGEPYYRADTCLINCYNQHGTVGIHQDNTESYLEPAIISISLGADQDFCYGGSRRSIPYSVRLRSGDVLVMSGEHRMSWHGVPKPPIPDTGPTEPIGLKPGHRIALTIRQVTR